MFDPSTLGDSLKPGDKIALTFHKAKAEPGGPSFMDNVRSQQTQAPPAPPLPGPSPLPLPSAGPMASPMQSAGVNPLAHRLALLQAMKTRMGQV
jgi:hypothetical protein